MHRNATGNPIAILEANYPPEQFPTGYRKYQTGFEAYYNLLPVIKPNDLELKKKLLYSRNLLDAVAEIIEPKAWLKQCMPQNEERDRITLAIETDKRSNWSGAQMVVGRWAKGHVMNIHGHPMGLTYERVLFGKVLNRRFKVIDDETVVLESEKVMVPGDVFSEYGGEPHMKNFVHQMIAMENTATLHYLAEYDRAWQVNNIFHELNPVMI